MLRGMGDVVKAEGRTFDRVPEASQNAQWPVARAIQVRTAVRTRVEWTVGPILDQGQEGACVGFAWTQEALSSPVRVDLAAATQIPRRWPHDPEQFARRAYYAMQRHDQWEGGEYPGASPVMEGTSVVAGARTMARCGLIREYRWAHTTGEAADAILRFGPAVLGVVWMGSMFDAPDGVVRVTGSAIGGHCVLLNGYAPDRDLGNGPTPAYLITNSWGPDGWGIGGQAWISETDLATLLRQQGEVCVPVSRSYGR